MEFNEYFHDLLILHGFEILGYNLQKKKVIYILASVPSAFSSPIIFFMWATFNGKKYVIGSKSVSIMLAILF